MKKINVFVKKYKADIHPAKKEDIDALESKIGFCLSEEYREFLSKFGVISYKSHEVYGLGVPDDYYLNVFNAYSDLKQDKSYPHGSLPLLEIGDGSYYLLDMSSGKILLWASPNGGIVKEISCDLESFLIKKMFDGS